MLRFLFYLLIAIVMSMQLQGQAQLLVNLSTTQTTVQSGIGFTMDIGYSVPSIGQSANNAVITMPLPSGVMLDGSWTNSLITDGIFSSASVSGGTVTFTAPNPVAGGTTGSVSVNLKFPEGTTPNNFQACFEATMTASNATTATSSQVCLTAEAVQRFSINSVYFAGGGIGTGCNYTTWRIRIANPSGNNIGGLNIPNAQVTIQLPAGVTYYSSTQTKLNAPLPAPTVSGSTVTFDVGDLIVSQYNRPAYVQIYITLEYNTGTYSPGNVVTNTACLQGSPIGESPINLCDSDTKTLIACDPEVTILKYASIQPFNRIPGCSGSYAIYPSNEGTTPLTNVVITDTLPSTIQLNSLSTGTYSTYSGTISVEYFTNLNSTWTGVPGSPLNPSNSSVMVSSLGLASGEYIRALRYTFNDTLMPGFSTLNAIWLNYTILNNDYLTNQAVMTGDTIRNCANIQAEFQNGFYYGQGCVSFVIADIAPNITAYKYVISTGPYFPGSTARYRMQFTNSGTADLLNAEINDNLPSGFEYAGNLAILPQGVAPPLNLTSTPNANGATTVNFDFSSIPTAGCGNPNFWWQIEFDVTITSGTLPGNYCNNYTVSGSNTNTVKTSTSACLTVNSLPSLSAVKQVQGANDANFSSSGSTYSGGMQDYRITVTNTGNVGMTEITIIDILPYPNDVGVVDWITPRGSQYQSNLIGAVIPISLPPGTQIYYSTETNPCRDELGFVGQPSGCVSANWQDYATFMANNSNDISQARSIKFEFGSYILQPGQNLMFEWPARTPVGTPEGFQACNSFGIIAKRTDNGQFLLATEPEKVCVTVEPIIPGCVNGFVWDDENEDGIQDQGEAGINGVIVELWNVGPNTTPECGSGDDYQALDNNGQPIPFTVTSNDANNDPGYYEFSNVEPGTYYVKFTYPPGSAVSPQGQDSDVNPATGCSDTFILTIDSECEVVDMGLYPASVVCDDYFLESTTPSSEERCCYNIFPMYDEQVTSIEIVTTSPVDITWASAASGWTVTPSGGTYPTMSVTFSPPSGTSGVGQLELCINNYNQATGTVDVIWHFGDTTCTSEFRFDCKPTGDDPTDPGGNKFFDTNHDGVKDPDEPVRPGVNITITRLGEQRPFSEAVTDERGNYNFANVEPGTYIIREILPKGWVQTYPPQGAYRVTIPTDDDTHYDFGNDSLLCTEPTDIWQELEGTQDDFVGPEPTTLSPDLVNYHATFFINHNLLQFDQRPSDTDDPRFLGHTFGNFGLDSCQLMGAELRIRLINTGYWPSISNDALGFLQGGNVVWYQQLNAISAYPLYTPQTLTFDLSNLPADINNNTDVLASLLDGQFDFFVHSYAMVDWAELTVYICCAPQAVDSVIIEGQKYNDINANGTMDGNESGLAGWVIQTDDGNNNIYSAVTDANGYYSITVPAPGNYTVSENNQVNWYQTEPQNPNDYPVSVQPNQSYTGYDFGNTFKPRVFGRVCGMKFFDANNNGAYESGEQGLANWTITFDDGNGNTYTAITDAEGRYCITLPVTDYTVSELNQPGWSQTYPPMPFTHSITVVQDSVINDINFGNFRKEDVPKPCLEINEFKIVPSDTLGQFDVSIEFINLNAPANELFIVALTPGASLSPGFLQFSTPIGTGASTGTLQFTLYNHTLPQESEVCLVFQLQARGDEVEEFCCPHQQFCFKLPRETSVGKIPVPQTDIDLIPNPASSSVNINVYTEKATEAWITLVDALGAEVARIKEGEFLNQGYNSITLDTSDLPSGIYYITYRTAYMVVSEKLMIVR